MDIKLSEVPVTEFMPGYFGKMVHTQSMTLAFWDVIAGAIVPEHSHVNEQIMHVLEGRFEFTVAGVSHIYGPGELVVVPSHVPHGGKALTPCKLMDVFCPVREAYR